MTIVNDRFRALDAQTRTTFPTKSQFVLYFNYL